MTTITAAQVADGFIAAVSRGELDEAFHAVSPAAQVVIHPTGQAGGPAVARDFFEAALLAFPDLMLTVTRRTACGDGRVLLELTFEGTQSADFLGVIDTGKHADIEQSWLLATQDGLITAITGYWDQSKLYRRLAVKRLDQIAIAGSR